MRFPIRLVRGGWAAGVEARMFRFTRIDPRVLLDPNVSGDEFREAMSSIHVGATIKITGENRHPDADELLTDHLDLAESSILDIGASDGSTSADLIIRLGEFKSYVVADLYFHLSARILGPRLFLYDGDNNLVLISGRRFVAWPSLSKFVAFLYRPLIKRAQKPSVHTEQVLLLNPSLRNLMKADSRISYQVHDVFTAWQGQSPDVIKVANLLRRLYFSDDRIKVALDVLLDALTEGGHLLVVDNPRIDGIVARAGLYQKSHGLFVPVAHTEHESEIDDLVRTVGAAT